MNIHIIADVGAATVGVDNEAFHFVVRAEGHLVDVTVDIDTIADLAARTSVAPSGRCTCCGGSGVVCHAKRSA